MCSASLSFALHGVTRAHKTAVMVAGIVEGRSLQEEFMGANQNCTSVSLSVCLCVCVSCRKVTVEVQRLLKVSVKKKKKSRPCAVVLFRRSR